MRTVLTTNTAVRSLYVVLIVILSRTYQDENGARHEYPELKVSTHRLVVAALSSNHPGYNQSIQFASVIHKLEVRGYKARSIETKELLR